ncbi:MAG: hypothetical protein IKA00_11235, partial [Prevotella sp.]|nr:hypothetical protein [Prevotella sp.]
MRKRGKLYSKRLICFDIETTHEVVNEVDLLFTWHWQAMVQDEDGGPLIYYTWDSWEDCLNGLIGLCEGKDTICFVHNLSYETEAIIRNLCGHKIDEIFASDTHKMLKFTMDNILEFRCSYFLTNKSLALCGKDVGLEKLEMDYQVVRRPGDKLTEEEESYCRRDVEIMVYKIRQLEKTEGMHFWDFPLTNTGFLRSELRNLMHKNPMNRKLFKQSKMTAKQFLACKDAFAGGYTHANYIYAGEVIRGDEEEGVDSYDFGSAYPFAMLVHKYPMGSWHEVKNPTWECIERLRRSKALFICDISMMAADGEKIVSRTRNTFLSVSKCQTTEDVVEDNGRVQSATMIRTTCTSIDLEIILKTYTVSRIKVNFLMWAHAGYLPKDIVKTMLKYYELKQNLKEAAANDPYAKESYMKAKNRVNSFYGMMVTNPLHDEIVLTLDEWIKNRLDYTDEKLVGKQLEGFYRSRNNFLAYQWGVFVPAYTRYHLWVDIIIPNDRNVLYCDTDSAKVINRTQCLPAIEKYNEWAQLARQKRLADLGYTVDFPDLGYFDHETKDGAWAGFLTWGAKKYLVQDKDGAFHMTVAGLSKKAVKYIKGFEDFRPGTIFGPDVSGRTVSHYITNVADGYDGGGCWIENTTYRLSVAEAYEILLSVRDDKAITMSYLVAYLISCFTFSIVLIFWHHQIASRVEEALAKR